LPLIVFYLLTFISLFISMRSNSILLIWFSLELNLLRFLPIIASNNNLAVENSIKYFLVQRWASILFLSSFMVSETLFNRAYFIITIAILIKLGTPPFHIWFITIIKTSPFFIILLLSTIQKMIPLYFISNVFFPKSLFFFILFFTRYVSISLLWTIININNLLGISSLININWILIRSQINFNLVILFIVVYFYLLLGLVLIFNKNNAKRFTQGLNKISAWDKVIIVLLFISLGGLPPFLGFLIKLIVIKFIIIKNNILLIILLIFISLMLLFHYLSRSYYLLTLYPKIKLVAKLSTIKISFYFFYFFSLIWFHILMVGAL